MPGPVSDMTRTWTRIGERGEEVVMAAIDEHSSKKEDLCSRCGGYRDSVFDKGTICPDQLLDMAI